MALAAASGAMFALASPPTDLYPCLWLGMAALAYLLDAAQAEPSLAPQGRWRRHFAGGGLGLAFGFGANVVALRFVPDVVARFTPLPWALGVVGLILLSLFEGLRWALAGMVCRAAVRIGLPRWLAFPMGVLAGSFWPTVFPWTAAGGATPWAVTVQLAELVGERGVTFVMATVAALLALSLRTRRIVPALVGLAIEASTIAYGALRIPAVDAARARAQTVKIALVQPSTEARERWESTRHAGILARLSAFTHAAEAEGAELTVWPEAAYPYPVAHVSRRAPTAALAILQPRVHGPVLTGLVMSGGPGDLYNSAAIATADGALSEPADKLHLLWFGETIPFADRFPWIRRIIGGAGLAAGERPVVLTSQAARIGVLNCFEDTLPDAGREVFGARDAEGRAPNLLVNITNDAWFEGSAESELHLRLAVLRSVELRRDMVRAVNEGPTSWIDAAGRVRARLTHPGFLMTEPALLDETTTPFAQLGDLPLVAALFAAACIALAQRWRARRAGTGFAAKRPSVEIDIAKSRAMSARCTYGAARSRS